MALAAELERPDRPQSWQLRLVSGVYVVLCSSGGHLGLLTNQLLCH